MKPRIRSLNEDVATALRRVIGGRLKQSHLGEVWRDDHTWRDLAEEFVRTLNGKVVVIERETYARLVTDAQQMRAVRAYVEEYKSLLSKEKQQDAQRNPYVKWAAENMKENSK